MLHILWYRGVGGHNTNFYPYLGIDVAYLVYEGGGAPTNK